MNRNETSEGRWRISDAVVGGFSLLIASRMGFRSHFFSAVRIAMFSVVAALRFRSRRVRAWMDEHTWGFVDDSDRVFPHYGRRSVSMTTAARELVAASRGKRVIATEEGSGQTASVVWWWGEERYRGGWASDQYPIFTEV